MPLYMDIHNVDSSDFSVEDVVKAHMEDLAIQDKFGVKQIKYWVNEKDKTIFCLMEGPSKEACHNVHKESHGNTACNIIEVSDDEYNLYFSLGKSVNDLAYTEKGDIDVGFRTILLISIRDTMNPNKEYYSLINELITQHNGIIMLHPDEDLMVSFVLASDAIICSKQIEDYLSSISPHIEYNLSIVSGKPVDETGNDLFEEARKKVTYLNFVGKNNSVYIDEETLSLAKKNNSQIEKEFRLQNNLSKNDLTFLLNLFEIFNENLYQESFSSSEIHKIMGMSKSQSYRKIKSATGFPPNQLIQEIRMRKSLKILKQNDRTIAETAFDLGFNSPTYFTKVFHKRFNITPTEFSKTIRT